MAERRVIVRDLISAIELEGEYKGASAFMIAPVTGERGRPVWWGVKEVHGKLEWAKEKDEPNCAMLDDVGNLPDLPPSPKSQWLLGFVDKQGDLLRPYVVIDPNVIDVTPEPQPPPPPGAPRAPRMSVPTEDSSTSGASSADALGALVAVMRDQSKQQIALVQEHQKGFSEIRASYELINRNLREELELERQRRIQAENQYKEALGANSELATQIAYLKHESQGHETIRVLFKEKPELLVNSVREFATGILQTLQATPDK